MRDNHCISQLLSRCCCTADWDLYIFLLIFGWYFYWHLDDIFIDIWIFLLIFGYFYWYLDDICSLFWWYLFWIFWCFYWYLYIFIEIWMIFVWYSLGNCSVAAPLLETCTLFTEERLFYYILLYESGHELIGQLSSYIIFARYLPDFKKNSSYICQDIFLGKRSMFISGEDKLKLR